MRTKEFSKPTGGATVRTANRKTPIIEAVYQQALRAASPELANVSLPSQESDVRDMVVNRPLPLVAQHIIDTFVPLAARLIAVTGLPFRVGVDGRFNDADLNTAYAHFLDEGEDEGFWFDVDRKSVV